MKNSDRWDLFWRWHWVYHHGNGETMQDGLESDLIGMNSADSPPQRRPMFYYVAHPCWKTLSPSNLESTFGSIFEHIGHSMDLSKFHHDRSLFSRTLESWFIRGISPKCPNNSGWWIIMNHDHLPRWNIWYPLVISHNDGQSPLKLV